MESINKMLAKQTNVTIALIRDNKFRCEIDEVESIRMSAVVTI